jgi:hypothetical protein
MQEFEFEDAEVSHQEKERLIPNSLSGVLSGGRDN